MTNRTTIMTTAALSMSVLLTSGAFAETKGTRISERREVNGWTSAPLPSQEATFSERATAFGPTEVERPATSDQFVPPPLGTDPVPGNGPVTQPDGPITIPPRTFPPNEIEGPDFNEDFQVDILDLMYFLAGYFTHDPRADLNGDGRVDPFDLIDALNILGPSLF